MGVVERSKIHSVTDETKSIQELLARMKLKFGCRSRATITGFDANSERYVVTVTIIVKLNF